MTDQTAQEPTMEEILASIRRIISEDDAPAETAAAAPETVVEVAPEPVLEAAPLVEEPEVVEDEVLELTERYEAPASQSIGDLDVADVAPFPAVDPEPMPAPAATPDYDSLVGESAAASAASAFAGLHASFKKPEPAPSSGSNAIPFVSGNTVEAMVADMLRPMLKDWLDTNLPAMVEAMVAKEIRRITGRKF